TQPRGTPRVPRGAPSVGGYGGHVGAPMKNWRLLVTEPCDGATNMAIDEALWRGRHAGTSPPTVRFFAWDPPTVSVGYGQPPDRPWARGGPRVLLRAHGRVRDRSRRPQARRQRPASPGHVVSPARRRPARGGRHAPARAVPDHA